MSSNFSRRQFLTAAAGMTVSSMLPRTGWAEPATLPAKIDRRAVVSRHNIHRTKSVARTPLQVGNGTIALAADITGLQTFVPFNILSEWGWFYQPMRDGTSVDQMNDIIWQSRSRGVPYDSGDSKHPYVTNWIFSNPSRINLARIGLNLINPDGKRASESDLTDCHQTLDLWTGILTSRFKLDGQQIVVTTACNPSIDAFAVTVHSPAIATGQVSAFVDFPNPDNRQFADYVGSYQHPTKYPANIRRRDANRIDLHRQLEKDQYFVSIKWNATASLRHFGKDGDPFPKIAIIKARYGTDGDWADVTGVITDLLQQGEIEFTADTPTLKQDPAPKRVKRLEITYTVDGVEHSEIIPEHAKWSVGDFASPNRLRITATGDKIEFTVAFSPDAPQATLPEAAETLNASSSAWPIFWQSGGVIDLSESKDPRWKELERRIVLSQYLMKANESGTYPPQESGLVNNGWFGKFHMEMYWWHAAHYALWNRWEILDRSSSIYTRMLPEAKARAAKQGYRGARWTKMTGPDFRNSAFYTNALLIWQQPHPMFFAELEYRARPSQQTLDKWKDILFAAAEFMATYPEWNPDTKRFDLGPPMMLVAENTNNKKTINPTFELSYWRFGLRVAQTWGERLKLPRDENWDKVLNNLAPLPIEDGVYVSYEGIPEMWKQYTRGHPALIGAFGWLPGDGVNRDIMRATLEKVMSTWQWHNDTWGWDYPMLAMCAARLGEPERAIDLLLTPLDSFGFDDAGLATGGPYPYFPSNGGLLYAVAMMAAGWDGCPKNQDAPGFPQNGNWVVKHENLSPAI